LGTTHDPKRLREIMADAAPPELELAFRPMFGGIMAYAEGKPFASLSNVGMALKAKGPVMADFLAVAGAAPLRYRPDAPPSKSYVVVPEAMLDDREALRDWIARAWAVL
jgi:TfoX/Sxy family transcriptional regulator of competence genes